jgi:hypothetical protein
MSHIGRKTWEMPRFGPGLNAHRLVAETAVEMANELFEVYARDNATFHALRGRGEITTEQARLVFVDRVAPRLLSDARQALAACLKQPDDVMPRAQKDEIAEALILDAPLQAARFVAADQATVPRILH